MGSFDFSHHLSADNYQICGHLTSVIIFPQIITKSVSPALLALWSTTITFLPTWGWLPAFCTGLQPGSPPQLCAVHIAHRLYSHLSTSLLPQAFARTIPAARSNLLLSLTPDFSSSRCWLRHNSSESIFLTFAHHSGSPASCLFP